MCHGSSTFKAKDSFKTLSLFDDSKDGSSFSLTCIAVNGLAMGARPLKGLSMARVIPLYEYACSFTVYEPVPLPIFSRIYYA